MKPSFLAAGLAFAATFAFGGPAAAALDVPCLWSSMPPQRQTVFMDHFDKSGLAGLRTLPLENADVQLWITQCGATTENGQAAGYIVGTYVMENASARALAEDYKIPTTRLNQAWAGVPESLKSAARAEMKASLAAGKPADVALPVAVKALMTSLNLKDEARPFATFFVFGILARELKRAEAGV